MLLRKYKNAEGKGEKLFMLISFLAVKFDLIMATAWNERVPRMMKTFQNGVSS